MGEVGAAVIAAVVEDLRLFLPLLPPPVLNPLLLLAFDLEPLEEVLFALDSLVSFPFMPAPLVTLVGLALMVGLTRLGKGAPYCNVKFGSDALCCSFRAGNEGGSLPLSLAFVLVLRRKRPIFSGQGSCVLNGWRTGGGPTRNPIGLVETEFGPVE